MNAKKMFRLAYSAWRAEPPLRISSKLHWMNNSQLKANELFGMEAYICLGNRKFSDYMRETYLIECVEFGRIKDLLNLQTRYF